jgi:hypothetical protein
MFVLVEFFKIWICRDLDLERETYYIKDEKGYNLIPYLPFIMGNVQYITLLCLQPTYGPEKIKRKYLFARPGKITFAPMYLERITLPEITIIAMPP